MLFVGHVSRQALGSEGILDISTFGNRFPVFWVSYPDHGLTKFSPVLQALKPHVSIRTASKYCMRVTISQTTFAQLS